ncbi:MAG: ATP-binding protein [Burkholderiaceae bacterium]|nr:ATP-binding protein [Burkholderiaceae bacterium]
MNAPESLLSEAARVDDPAGAPPLWRIALAALVATLPRDADGVEADWLRGLADEPAHRLLHRWLLQAPATDAGLRSIAQALNLDLCETVATALALAIEFDPMVGRALAWLQAPVGGARPTLGLLARLCPLLGWGGGGGASGATPARVVAALCDGPARACGLWQLDGESRPLTEQALQLPLPLALALQVPLPAPSAERVGERAAAPWPGLRWLDAPAPWPPSLQQALRAQAAALGAAGPGAVLVLRSGHPQEARDAAAALAGALGWRAIGLDGTPPVGLGPWLTLQRTLPVLLAEGAPGESLRLPLLPGWRGPLLVAAGLDGQVQADVGPAAEWTVPLPLAAERAALWSTRLSPELAQCVGRRHRHSVRQIQQIGRAAHHFARLEAGAPDLSATTASLLTEDQIRHATRQGSPGGLGALAQWLPDAVPDEALVVTPALRAALDALRERCERREGLADALGPAARTRYRPGVRALLVGASGTGKTLAVGWLATRLGLPLYRVDLASVSSKYIGETEKNLAQLFARAEHAEVVLLFDEADSLFGKRTEVKDANDRFANQQTNYLLQRIESFDGIALLTSNSRSRFDSAFTRRLDAIIDFPPPGPQERRALWLAHLGGGHGLDEAQLNRIAAGCDLAGGHIRNATLAAVAAADGPVDYAGLHTAIEAEYRKLGRQPPAGL